MFQFPGFASTTLCIQVGIPHKCGGFSHSEIRGSEPVCWLTAAYRKLQRPSSPVVAKASTRCACSLDHITSSTLEIILVNDHHGLYKTMDFANVHNTFETIENTCLCRHAD